MSNEKAIRYFSMFSGVGGFELGIEKAGRCRSEKNLSEQGSGNSGCKSNQRQYTFDCVGFSEIDKYANQLLANKFPTISNFGDATKIEPNKLPDFDMLCGGFPCQSFSIAGKRRGFEDTRGTMFFHIARILEIKRPKFVFLENVKGLLNHDKGKTFSVIIQTLEELGYNVQWMVLNSKFFGVPQNRERVFIIGSIRGQPRPEILPFRKNYSEITEECPTTNSGCITSRYFKQGNADTYINEIGIAIPGSQAMRVYTDELAPTLKGLGGGMGAKTGLFAMRSYPRTSNPEEDKKNGRFQNMEFRKDDCTNTLSSVEKDNLLSEGMRIRRLTPIECERLQGFPDNWTSGFSDTQRYKMMGNAVTVNVIYSIIDSWFNSHHPNKPNESQVAEKS